MTTERELYGRGTKAERETSREKARGYREEREAKESQPSVTRGYLEYAFSTYQGLVEQGYLSQDIADRYMNDIATYIDTAGLTPKLPYYEGWQVNVAAEAPSKEKERLDLYERVKPYYLTSTDMDYWDKVKALVRLHPQGARADIFREIKNEVFPTLTMKDIDPGIARHYQSRYDKSQTDEPYPQWLIHQGLASLAGGAGEGEGGPSKAPRRLAGTTGLSMRYEPAFEAERQGLGGAQPWKNWFENMYGTLIRRYKGTVEEPKEETWAEYLKAQKPGLREEFYKRGAYGRGERPSAFQTSIRTVSF